MVVRWRRSWRVAWGERSQSRRREKSDRRGEEKERARRLKKDKEEDLLFLNWLTLLTTNNELLLRAITHREGGRGGPFSVYISNYCFYLRLRDQSVLKFMRTDTRTDGQIDACTRCWLVPRGRGSRDVFTGMMSSYRCCHTSRNEELVVIGLGLRLSGVTLILFKIKINIF